MGRGRALRPGAGPHAGDATGGEAGAYAGDTTGGEAIARAAVNANAGDASGGEAVARGAADASAGGATNGTVTLLLDTGALYAQANRREPHHEAVAALIRGERGLLVTSEAVAAEADYLILTRLGVDAELAFLRDLAEGSFSVECLDRAERRTALKVARQYRDLGLGLADASLIVLAQRHNTQRIATLDERGFRAVTPLQGGTFTVLPADE